MRGWLVGLGLLLPSVALADPALTQYRQRVMEGANQHLKAVKSLVLQGVPLQDQLPAHLDALAAFSRQLPDLFPAGSQGGDARQEIWRDRAAFLEAVRRNGDAVRTLGDAVRRGDGAAMGKGYYAVLDGCKGCHRDFRADR